MTVSPVTENAQEDAFYARVEASLDAPTRAGYWWADGPDGRKLLVVDIDTERDCQLARLADAIHGWPLWFKPDLSVWRDWIKL